jgi:major membrane immunogen (membrane-anchored lipoprotein)
MLITITNARFFIYQLLWVIALISVINGCGSAEPVKGYRYQTNKYNLEKSLLKVIKSNPHIYLDTSQNKVVVKRNPGDSTDTATDTINVSAYHGDDSADIDRQNRAFVTIRIKSGEEENVYWFRYYGDERYWRDAKSSEIFIVSAFDKSGNGIQQGQNEHGEFRSELAKDLTGLFEAEFINKLDAELNLQHTGHSFNEPVTNSP